MADETLDALRKAMKGAGSPKASPLLTWMRQHRAEFAALLATTRRPNWLVIAGTFAAQGLRDANGNPPTAKVAQNTWWKVKREAEQQHLGTEPPPQNRRAEPSPRRPAPPREETPDGDDDEPLPRIGEGRKGR